MKVDLETVNRKLNKRAPLLNLYATIDEGNLVVHSRIIVNGTEICVKHLILISDFIHNETLSLDYCVCSIAHKIVNLLMGEN